MRTFSGHVAEIQLNPWGSRSAWITCPPAAIPPPGRYLLGHLAADLDAPLASPLFASQTSTGGFQAAALLPSNWEPGARLELHGPLGQGFTLPENTRRLILVGLAESPARLLPLALLALQRQTAAALFTDSPTGSLPSALEIQPLASLPEALAWADFIALDLSLETLPDLRRHLGADRLPCPAQALVATPMPCAGMAECGACAVPVHRGWKLACADGPVFNLSDLEW